MRRLARALTAVLLSAAILGLSPGPAAYEALASMRGRAVSPATRRTPVPAGGQSVPVVTFSAPLSAPTPAAGASRLPGVRAPTVDPVETAAGRSAGVRVQAGNGPTVVTESAEVDNVPGLETETLPTSAITGRGPAVRGARSKPGEAPATAGKEASAPGLRGSLGRWVRRLAGRAGVEAGELEAAYHNGRRDGADLSGTGTAAEASGRDAPRRPDLARPSLEEAVPPESGLPPPAAVETGAEPAPRSSLWRAAKVGFLTAWLSIAAQSVLLAAAVHAGHDFSASSYEDPFAAVQTLSALNVARDVYLGSVMAPIGEEVLMRAGLMGAVALAVGTVKRGAKAGFWVPALSSSLVFVAYHETGDAVLFGVRMVGALIMARVFYREGLMASMLHHGVFNFFAVAVPLAALIALGPAAAFLNTPALAVVLSAPLAWLAWKALGKERADRAARRLVPYRLTGRMALLLSGLLVLGIAALAPISWEMLWYGLFWFAVPALALWYYGLSRLRAPAPDPGEGIPTDPAATRAGFRAMTMAGGAYAGLLAAQFAWMPAAPVVIAASVALMLAARFLKGRWRSSAAWTGLALAAVGLGALAYSEVLPGLYEWYHPGGAEI